MIKCIRILGLLERHKTGSWESMALFLDDLYDAQVTPNASDKSIWFPSPKEGFQTKSYYRVL